MRTTRNMSLCIAAALCVAVALSAGVASAAPRKVLILRKAFTVEAGKVGAPTDNFESFSLYSYTCSQSALGKLLSNEQPTDKVAFSGYKERDCGETIPVGREEMRVVSGGIKQMQLSVSGKISETTNWDLEVPGPCVYKLTKMQGVEPIGQEPSRRNSPAWPNPIRRGRLRMRHNLAARPVMTSRMWEADSSPY